jgi:LPXTG-motif cell wall-anchored protein
VRFTLRGASVEARFNGGRARVTLKAPAAAGGYEVTAVGLSSGCKASAKLTVTGGGRLPSTGSNSSAALWIGGSALIAGLGLTGVAVRRRRPISA